MTRRAMLLLLLTAALCVAVLLEKGSGNDAPSVHSSPETVSRPQPPRAGREPAEPDREWIAAARLRFDGASTDRACGPYLLVTDLDEDIWSHACSNIAAEIDATYAARFGVVPVSSPRGAIVIFSRPDAFRSFASDIAHLPVGYLAFTGASKGIVALSAPPTAADLAATFAHELAHLLNRRAFGPRLPPWLSEGLAEALSDTATVHGFLPLSPPSRLETEVSRLMQSIARRENRPLPALLSVTHDSFDREIRSSDYEQSALLVRFLLLEPDLAPGFRRFLFALAAGEPYSADSFSTEIGVEASELERRFHSWLRSSTATR